MKSVNLSEGEVLSIRGVDNGSLVLLANQTLLVEGQVIRSPTNTISVYFRTFPEEVVGTFQLHYQGTCARPAAERSRTQPSAGKSPFSPCAALAWPTLAAKGGGRITSCSEGLQLPQVVTVECSSPYKRNKALLCKCEHHNAPRGGGPCWADFLLEGNAFVFTKGDVEM